MADHTFTAETNSLEIVSTYVFDASPKQVFEAYTNPDLIPKWWGEDDKLEVEKMEVKPGGSWRFVMGSDNHGDEYRFRGVYHDVIAPKKLVATWQYEDMPIVILQTTTFDEQHGGKTKVIDQMVFQSVEDRQMMLDTGMNEGSIPMMERLAKLI
jgi:uncharacterized protein YndB with AHSA1/START domain